MRPMPLEPNTRRVAIGSRLRAARQAQQLTIDEVARITGLTKGFLSRVERDMTSPSVSSLITLCDVLSISVGSLFEAPDVQFVPAGTGPRINLGGQIRYAFPFGTGPGQRPYRVEVFMQGSNWLNRYNYAGYSGVMTSPFFLAPTMVLNPRLIRVGMALFY